MIKVKLVFDSQVRKFMVPEEDATAQVEILVKEIVNDRFKPVMKYKDEEGDWISISTNEDLRLCLQSMGVPKIHVLSSDSRPEERVMPNLEAPLGAHPEDQDRSDSLEVVYLGTRELPQKVVREMPKDVRELPQEVGENKAQENTTDKAGIHSSSQIKQEAENKNDRSQGDSRQPNANQVAESLEGIRLKEERGKPKVIHHGVTCDVCEIFPIVGVRYKCMTCPNFDLCERCHDGKGSHPLDHMMMVMQAPAKRVHGQMNGASELFKKPSRRNDRMNSSSSGGQQENNHQEGPLPKPLPTRPRLVTGGGRRPDVGHYPAFAPGHHPPMGAGYPPYGRGYPRPGPPHHPPFGPQHPHFGLGFTPKNHGPLRQRYTPYGPQHYMPGGPQYFPQPYQGHPVLDDSSSSSSSSSCISSDDDVVPITKKEAKKQSKKKEKRLKKLNKGLRKVRGKILKLTKQQSGVQIRINKLIQKESRVKKQINQLSKPSVACKQPTKNSPNPNKDRRSPSQGSCVSKEDRRSPRQGSCISKEGAHSPMPVVHSPIIAETQEEKQIYPKIVPKVKVTGEGGNLASNEDQDHKTSPRLAKEEVVHEEFAQQLIVLKEMGFTNVQKCKRLLRKNNGNIQKVALLQSQRF